MFVKDWKDCWKWASTWMMLVLVALPEVWEQMPPDIKAMLPEAWEPGVLLLLWVAAIFARIWNQGDPNA